MPHSLLAAATAAHSGLSQADSTTSFGRYEERVSTVPTIISRHMDPEDVSSKISILPPLTHPRQPFISNSTTSFASPPVPVPRRPVVNRHPSGAGAEPGVNPRRDSSVAKYCHYKQECLIDVIDYDAEDANIERFGNADFIRLMKSGYGRGASNSELDHPPKAARWINIGGIDWDVLSSMALRYREFAKSLFAPSEGIYRKIGTRCAFACA
jgi:hypothetical protein